MSHSSHRLSSPPAQSHGRFHAPPAGWRRAIFALITIFSTTVHLMVPMVNAGQPLAPALADAVLGTPKKASAAALPDTSVGLASNQFLTTVQPEENMVVNGSFEMGPTSLNQTRIPGWTVASGNVDVWSGYTRPDGSSRQLELDGTPGPGSITQTLTGLLAGATYFLEFDYGTQGSVGNKALVQVLNSSSTAILSQTVTSPNGDPNTVGWIPFRDTFVAPADGIVTLRFASFAKTPSADFGISIDDVRVAKRLINFVQNGGFENGPVQTNATANVPAWTVTAGNIDIYNNYVRPDGSTRFLFVNGNTPGTISQTVSGLTGNQTYFLDFEYSSEGNISTQAVVRLLNSSATQILSQTVTSPGDANNRGWQHFRTTFTAPADGIATLQFAGITAGANGLAVDNVRIADQPLNWVVNGDFEAGPAALNIANNAVPGWTIVSGPTDIYAPGLLYGKAVDLRGTPGVVTMEQTITGLVTGQVYVLQANFASNTNLNRWGFIRLFNSGGTPLLDQRVACDHDISYQGWCMLRYSFTAPADGIVKVQLADDPSVGGNTQLGLIVDNVSISRDTNFVANGSFSSGPTGLNQPFVPGWSMVDTPDVVDGQGGSLYRFGLDLKGSPASTAAKQNLSGLTPGATYVLRYNYFANTDGFDAAFTTQVTSVGGGTLISTTTNTGLNATPANKGMREARMSFTAPADGNVSITFRDVTDPANGYYGAFIDNVSVFGTASVAGILQIACASSAQSNISTGPGGVTNGLRFWTRADKGTYNNLTGTVAAAGDPIYRWNDQSGYSLDTVPTTSRAPTYRTGTAQSNFNPFIDFAGGYLVNYSQIMPAFSDMTMLAVGNKTTNSGISTIFSTGENGNDPTFDVTNLDFNPWSDYSSPASVTHLGSPVTQGKTYLFDMRARNGVNDNLIAGLSGYDHANGMEILGDSDLYMFRKANIGSDGGGENWVGGVNENVIFDRVLTGTELARVRSYLAVRNGLTLDITPTLDAANQNYDYLDSSGATIWAGNGANVGYHNNIAGIGRDDASALDQRQANSVYAGYQPAIALGAIAATNASVTSTFSADKSYLMWGSNSAAATFGTVYTPTAYTPPAGYFRMNRVWKVQKSGTVGSVEVQGPSTANLLLVSTDPTFATGVTEVALTNSKGSFTFASGQYFTFGAEATAPGGVNSGLMAWVMADAGTSTTSEGGAVSTWADQTQNHYDFTQATGASQPLYYGTTASKLVNYNPTLEFDGIDDHLRNTTTLMPSSSAYTFLSVGVDDGTDTAYRNLFSSEAIVDYFALYRNGGAPGDNGWVPYAIGGIPDRGSMGKGTKYSASGGPNGYWNGTNFTSDSRTQRAQPQIVGFNSLNSAIADPFYTWTDGYKENPNWSPIADGLAFRNQFFTQTSIGADINVEIWKGRIPEFMVYSQSLNDTQIRQINTYLAIKYGVTLGQGNGAVYNNAGNYDYLATDGTTVIWNATANSTYGYNIAGIGRDDAEGLNQLQSTSVNGAQGITVTMGLGGIAATNLANTGVFTANKSYLVWGDNNGAATLSSNYNGGTNNRITRRWKVQETGAVGTVKVRIPTTIGGLQTLIVNTSNTFGTIDREYPLTVVGSNYEADVDFQNNDFFTFSTDPVSTANLVIGKQGPATATQNTNYDYTLVVTNTGVVASSGQISVTDNLPVGLSYVGASGFSCAAAGQLVTCLSNATLAPNASVSITLTVNPTATGTMNNTASVIGGGDTSSASSNSVSTVINPPPADLQISKSAPVTATQNTNFNYTLVVTNTGGSASSGTITVTDALQAGLSFVSGSGSGFTCSASGQNVTCTGSTAIVVNGAATVTLAVNPTVSGTLSNTANVIGGGDVTSASSNSVNTLVGAAAAPDLTTTIGQPSPAFVAGSASNVPVTVTNGGTGPTTGAITTTFSLPTGTSAPASFSSNGNTCTTSGQTVTCVNPGPIAASGSNTIQVPVTPSASTVGTTPAFNATTATPGDSNTGNNAASPMTPSTPVASGADLTTSIGQPSPAFVAGASSNVPVTVTNGGTSPTSGPITTTFTLPTGTSAPASFSSNGNTCTTSGQTVTCVNPGPINNGSSNTIQVPVTPSASSAGTTPAPFNANATTTGETNTGNNAATPMTPSSPVATGADLTSTIGQPSPAMVANTASNLPVTVTNNGTGPTTGPITTTITLPANTSAPASFSSNGNTCTTSGQTVTCVNAGPIAAGASNAIQVPVTPNAAAIGTQPVFNATTATPGDTNTGNNAATPLTSSPAVAAAPAPDLTTTIGQPSPAFVAGAPSNVPVTVTNNGSSATTGPITTTFTLPSGTSAPANFTSNGNTCTTSGQTVTCVNPGPIAAGSSNTIQVPVTPSASSAGTTPAPFNASAATPGETNTGNNGASPMTPSSPVASGADLTTAIGQPSPALVVGAASNVPVTVTNTGTGPTTGPITTTFTLPSGTSAPASFSSNGNSCTTSGQTVTCVNAGPIAAGGSNTIQVPVTPNAGTVGTTPQFNASSATPGETNTGNNGATPMTPSAPVASGVDLTTAIGQPSPALVAGVASTVPVTVSNGGTGPTTGPITTTFTLPTGTSAPASFSSNGNTCTTSGQTVTCVNAGPIAAGGSNTIQVPVTPDNSTIGTTPQFNASSATPGETNTGNNGASPMTPAAPIANGADLTTTIGQPVPRFTEGQPSNVPVTVTNAGSGPTTGPITTTFSLPTGTSAPATFNSNGNSCTTSGQTVTCVNAGPIAAGSSNTIQVPVTPNNGTAGQTPAPFSASATTPGETNTGNNAASPMTPSQSVQSSDTTPPAPPVIVAPAAGSSTNDNTPTFSGTVEAGALVTVTEGATTLCAVQADGSGNWSCTPASNMSDGSHTVGVVARDAAGNVSTPPSTRTFTVDTAAPATPSVTAPAASSTVSDTTPTFSGTAEAGSTVTVKEGAATLCTAVANGSGNWNCDATAPLGDGLHVALVTATDPAGNISTTPATRAFTVDSTAPTAPAINAPAPNAVISNTTPTISGSAEAGSTVTVKDGATTVCTAVADGAGNWSCTSSALAAGPHSLTATATDPAGNTSSPNAPRALTVDNTAPTAPTLTAPAANATLGDSTVDVSGVAEPNSTVTVRDGAGGPVLCTATADGSGNFSCTTAALSNGPHTLAVEARDAAGNTGPAATRPITISNVGPAITAPAASSTVSTTTPLFTGVGVPNSTVVVKEGGTTLCTTLTDASGNWACAATAPLAQGAHSVTASVTDAGNNTLVSSSRTFTVDTVAPAAPGVTAPAANGSTNDSTPTIAGTAEAGSTVRVTDNGNPVCTAVADGSGNWSCDATAPLSEGPHTLSVTATDPAGNTGPAATRPFSVDTLPPAAPTVTAPTLNSLLNTATPTVSGQAEPNATVVVKDGPGGPTVCTTTANASGVFSCPLSTPLSQGPHTLSANTVDAAGNAGPNVTVPVSVDSVAPNAPAITAPTNGAVLPGQTPTIAGTAEPNAAITVKDGATTVCTTTASAGGAWSCQPGAPLSNGAHALTATATDVAGNTSLPSTPISITINTSGNNDDDGDGISNIVECPGLSSCTDADGDGVPDYLDTDSDNDGVLDQLEGLNDTDGDGIPNRLESFRVDSDGDGIPNQQDADDDGDGIPTLSEDINSNGNRFDDDRDGDGIPAFLDPNDAAQQANGGDSDGDGISDKVECPAGLSGKPCPDTDGDGVPDYRDADSDGDGKTDQQEGTADTDGDGVPNRLESSKADTDGDGKPNPTDIDDDGDGILTAQEDLNGDGDWRNDDADKDGIPAYLDPNDAQQSPNGGDGDNDGISDKLECPLAAVGGRCPDTDGDGVPDYLDSDSDNDGISDAQEGTTDSDGDGLPNRMESNRADTDGDGVPNQQDADDDGDGTPTAQEDLNADGNFLNDDADKDGIPAYLDKNDPSPVQPNGGDSDGDGISDKLECPGGLTGSPCPDTDGDGVPDYRDADSDGDNTPDAQEASTDSDGDGIPNRLESDKADTDGDGIPNPQDADDDGDGIPTAQEDLNDDGNFLNDDADRDGIPAYLDPNDHQPGAGDADNDGISDKVECVVGPVCADTDGDGKPDYMDADSDGDGALDAAEGIADGDGDGLPDRLESNRADTDGDGIANQQDADDDGDGKPTKQEDLNGDGNWVNDDADKDGIPAYLDPNDAQKLPNGGDADNDGTPDKTECNAAGTSRCVDTDGDGKPDYMDADSDGDGTSDAVEGTTTDSDDDGIPNRLESSKADTDNDGRPNQQDDDDDGDGRPTAQEDLNNDKNWLNDDADKDGIPAYLDSNDHLPNQVDGGDSDNDGISDKAECTSGPACPDTDGDGVPDYRDTDSDGDGQTDLREGTADADGDGLPNRLEPNNVDTDGDGIPNNKDADDDGDGVPTALEDLNGDGNWMDDDPNGNGVPAYLDKGEPSMTPTVTPKIGLPRNSNGQAQLDGTAPAGSPVTVREGNRVVCTTTANAQGQWSCSAPLSLGLHLLIASVTDGSGATYTSTPAFVMIGRGVYAPMVMRQR